MSDAIFANMYIEKVLNELLEHTKIRLMNETRIAYLENQITELNKQIEDFNTPQSGPVAPARKTTTKTKAKLDLSDMSDDVY